MSNSTAIRDPRVGTVVQERYRLLQRLAAGGMGVVYRAERVGLGRQVAVKFLHPWIATDASFKSRFELEAQVMGRLNHPCCVSIIDSGLDEDAPFLVMDYVTGPTLRLVLQEGPLAPPRAVGLVRQVLAGLAHAHAQGVIHRDLKPENIVLTETIGFGEQVRLLDFGLAKLRDAASGLTMGLVVGTPNYMPPEQVRAEAVDERTDLYALGVVLFELLTGRAPFAAEQTSEILHRQLHATPPPLAEIVPDGVFSRELEAVLSRALAKAPAERFQSASDFTRALEGTPEARVVPAQSAAASAERALPGATPLPLANREHPPRAALAGGAAVQRSASHPDPAEALHASLRESDRSGRSDAPGRGRVDRAGGFVEDVAADAIAPTRMSAAQVTVNERPVVVAAPDPVPARPGRAWTPGSDRFRPLAALAAFLVLAGIGAIMFAGGRADETPRQTAEGEALQPAATKSSGTSAVSEQEGTPGEPMDEAAALVRIRQLAADGQRDRALREVEQLRKAHPRSAAAAVLQGRINFDNLRWADGLSAYRAAIRLAPALRSDADLTRDVIGCLVSDRAYRQCATFLLEDLGAPAIPHLEEAARTAKYANVQARARALLERGRFRQ